MPTSPKNADAVEAEDVELDKLPDGWVWTTIGSVTENFDGRRIPVTAMDRAAMRGPYPYYGASGVIDWVNRYLFDGNYLLITEDGVPLSQSKDIAFLASGKFWVNNHAHVVKTLGDLPLGFLKAYANSVNLQGYVTGTTRLKLTQAALNSIPVPLAPLPEQHRIVAEIEKQFTRLYASVAALKRVQANLKRYRASVLKAACEGKLVPTEAELARSEGREYEPADHLLERVLAERRAHWESQEKRRGKYREPVALDTSDSPELPEGWVWAMVDALLSEPLSNGRSVKTASGGFPVLRLTALRQGQIDQSEFKNGAWTAQEAERFLIREGDFLVSRGNGSIKLVGLGGLVGPVQTPVAYPDTLIRFRLHPEVAITFFAHLWNSSMIRDQLESMARTTAGIYKVNQQDLSLCWIPLPPLSEQCRIVAEVERRLSVAQKAEVSIEANLLRVERLRQSILKQAFSGKLVPQDPNDEPASALLERIRVEREDVKAVAKNSRQTRPRRGKSLSARQPALREGNP